MFVLLDINLTIMVIYYTNQVGWARLAGDMLNNEKTPTALNVLSGSDVWS